MRYNPIPKKGDHSINFSTWLNVVNNTRKLLNLRFDPTIFYTSEDPTGLFVSMYPPNVISTSTGEHFDVAINSCTNTSTNIIVHAGSWDRFVGPYGFYVPMEIDGSDTSRHYINTYSISTSINTQAFVYLELDNPEEPTTCTPKIIEIPDDDFPEETMTQINGDYNKQIIAYVKFNINAQSNTYSADVEQYFSGDIIQSHLMPDTHLGCNSTSSVKTGPRRSIEVEEGDLGLGIYNFNNVQAYTFSSEDLVILRQINPDDSKPEVVYSECQKAAQIVTNVWWTGTTLMMTVIKDAIVMSNNDPENITITIAEECA